jgi:hypothetical protein
MEMSQAAQNRQSRRSPVGHPRDWQWRYQCEAENLSESGALVEAAGLPNEGTSLYVKPSARERPWCGCTGISPVSPSNAR